jgi:thiol:disulfide interchange protein DsbC
LTAAKKDQKIDSKTCDNPVDEHMAIANRFDVKGTPMIVTEQGTVYQGYFASKTIYEKYLKVRKNKNQEIHWPCRQIIRLFK